MVKKNSATSSSLNPRDRKAPATSIADTFTNKPKGKRTQLSIAVDEQFRARLSLAAKAKGLTQRDFVCEAVELLIKENSELIEQYTKNLVG